MAKLEIPIVGTSYEQNTFTEVNGHYSIAKQDLEDRISRKNGFNDADKMVMSYIDENNWPYRSLMFDPRPFTVLIEKSARLIGSKPKGRLVPREGGDTLGAYINNEILSFQWDDVSRLGESMLSRWQMMDQNTRKYGASYSLEKWHYETRIVDGKRKVFFDGPATIICNPRDVLANPSYSFIKKWFQYREYVTLDELEGVNDAAKSAPVYKNLSLLRDSMRKAQAQKGDRRDTNYIVQNKSNRGLQDFLGRDELYPPIEIITEYRPERWITFAPKHGIIVRDIPNPYKHGEIPVVQLKYYPLPDDLYGLSEFEPSARLIRAINSHLSAYSDSIALSLRPPLMINPINVRMHTLDFVPEAKWLMNNPNVDAQMMKMDTSITQNFQSIYSTLVGSLLNSWGEASQGFSQLNPTQDQGRVTATEVKDTAFTRNVRDNMNQLFLAEALKKQIMFWHSMNQQFMFQGTKEKYRVMRIVGRDAVEYFKRSGLADIRPTDEDATNVANGTMSAESIVPGPVYSVGLETGEDVPKFSPDTNGEGGDLYVEQGDLMGSYDYVPDIESMKAPSDQDIEAKLTATIGLLTNPAVIQGLAAEGKRPKYMDILVKAIEATKVIRDAEALFEDLPPQPMMGGGVPSGQQDQAISPGGGVAEAGIPAQGDVGMQGMEGNPGSLVASQNQQFMG